MTRLHAFLNSQGLACSACCLIALAIGCAMGVGLLVEVGK